MHTCSGDWGHSDGPLKVEGFVGVVTRVRIRDIACGDMYSVAVGEVIICAHMYQHAWPGFKSAMSPA